MSTINKITTNLIKAAACLLIAVHHHCWYLWTNDVSHSWVIYPFSAFGGFIGVGIFFFLSGLGLMESEKNRHLTATQFVKHRFWKIIKPIIIVNILFLPILYFVGYEPVTEIQKSLPGLIEVLLFITEIKSYDPVMWFVKVLFLLYSFFCLSGFLAQKFKSKDLFFTGVLAMTLIYMLIGGFVFGLTYQIISVPAFPLGIYCSLHFDKVRDFLLKKYSLAIVPLIYVVLIAIFYLGFKDDILKVKLFTQLLNNIVIILLLLFVLIRRRKEITYKSKIAGFSYEVYLVHYKIMLVTISLWGFLIPLWIFIPVVLLTSFLINKIITNIGEKAINKRITA